MLYQQADFNRRPTSVALLIAMFLVLSHTPQLAALDWPIQRDSTFHPIGNSYSQYQCYGDIDCDPFLHTGIDLMAPEGEPVYAMKAGYVKAILTTSVDTHWRVVIGDSAGSAECEAWMYAHVDALSIIWDAGLSVGDTVEADQYIGNVVLWTFNDFNHWHLSKIRHAGESWENWGEWEYFGNPLDELEALNDPDAPVFENAYESQLLAFCQNQSDMYFAVGEEVTGDVDIVCRVYDYFNDYDHKLTPYRVEYMIDEGTHIPWTTTYCFTNPVGSYLEMDTIVDIIYQNDATCQSHAGYDIREYYINLTNTDGDWMMEINDVLNSWHTVDFNNGEHTVHVRAHDRAGNITEDSMTVSISNFFELSGQITVDDGNEYPPLAGAVVTVISSNLVDTTDESGNFSIPQVGGGSQIIEVSCSSFETADTVIMMNQNRELNLPLIQVYTIGDANGDGDINVADAVFVINYVFKGGAAPNPLAAGDANCDSETNVADAVYLIAYIFKGGPPPGADCLRIGDEGT
jgi:hypothetical protein